MNPKIKPTEATKALILYDCDPDGLAAAVVAGKFLTTNECLEVTYERAIRYQDPPFDIIDGDTEVYIVDFCYDKANLDALCAKASSVVIIDHHKSSMDIVLDYENGTNKLFPFIDMDHSACMLTWKYFYGEKNPPTLLEYIEDMDLWKWELEDSHIYAAAIDCLAPDPLAYMELLNSWDNMWPETWEDFKIKGEAIVAYKDKLMNILVKQAVKMNIGGHEVTAVNCSDPSLVSYLGNRMAEDVPFSATFHLDPAGKWKFSLRSIIGEGLPGVDVAEIAQKYGGGGHKQASGFKVDKLFPFKLIKQNRGHR